MWRGAGLPYTSTNYQSSSWAWPAAAAPIREDTRMGVTGRQPQYYADGCWLADNAWRYPLVTGRSQYATKGGETYRTSFTPAVCEIVHSPPPTVPSPVIQHIRSPTCTVKPHIFSYRETPSQYRVHSTSVEATHTSAGDFTSHTKRVEVKEATTVGPPAVVGLPTRKSDLASFAAATKYNPKSTLIKEPSLGELAVVRSPREAERGRGFRKLPTLETYRRNSRPRRPVSDKANLRQSIQSSMDGCQTSYVTGVSGPPCGADRSDTGNAIAAHTRGGSTVTEGESKKKVPLVPPLALTKVVKRNAPSTDTGSGGATSTGTGGRVRGASRYEAEVDPWIKSPNLEQWPLRNLPPFSDCIKPCTQPISPSIRVSSSVKPVYEDWIRVALRRGWVEESSDVHIQLKPKILRKSDGTWRIAHDCSIVNAMATAPLAPSCQHRVSAIHQWSLSKGYLARISLIFPALSVPLQETQRRYYGFALDGKIYRYCRMPKTATGANRHLQHSIQHALAQIPEQVQRSVKFRGEDIFVGGTSFEEKEAALYETIKVLQAFGFRSHKPVPLRPDTTRVNCIGLIHDRAQKCLCLPESKAPWLEKLVAELHTPRWAAAAEDLLAFLHQIAIILPMQWKKESNELRRILQTWASSLSLLDAATYLVWDEFPRLATGWRAEFHPTAFTSIYQ